MDQGTAFRPMRRFKQELPQDECMRILDTAYRGFLSVIGDGGYPYAVPLNFVSVGGKIYFHCAREGHKLDAVRASLSLNSRPNTSAGKVSGRNKDPLSGQSGNQFVAECFLGFDMVLDSCDKGI